MGVGFRWCKGSSSGLLWALHWRGQTVWCGIGSIGAWRWTRVASWWHTAAHVPYGSVVRAWVSRRPEEEGGTVLNEVNTRHGS